jgi:hypothetical protein
LLSLEALYLSFGLSPMFMSWILGIFLFFFPGQRSLTIFSLTGSSILLSYLFKTKVFANLKTNLNCKILQFEWGSCIAVTIGILIYITALTFNPSLGNDSMEYMKITDIISTTLNSSNYPINDYEKFNFYGPYTHPFGFIGVNLLFKLIGFPTIIAHKFVSFYYTFLTFIFLIIASREFNKKIIPIWPFSLLLFTQLYFTNSTASHIDSFRIFFFSCSMFYFYKLAKQPTRIYYFLPFVFTAFSIFSHSMGILALPLSVIGFVLVRKSIAQAFYTYTVIGILSLCFVGLDLYKNYLHYGAFIGDIGNVVTWTLPGYDMIGYTEMTRGSSLIFDKLLYGVFQGIGKTSSFTFSFWLFMATIFLIVSKRAQIKNEPFLMFCILIPITWLLFSVFGLMANVNYFIRNSRYFLTILPFLALSGSFSVQYLFEKISLIIRDRKTKHLIILLTITSIVSIVLWKFNLNKNLKITIAIIGILFLSLPLISKIYPNRLKIIEALIKISFFSVLILPASQYFFTMNYKHNKDADQLKFFLQSELGSKGRILSFYPSLISFYGKQKILNYLTKDLVQYLQIKNVDKLFNKLREDNITHIHIANGTFYPLLMSSQIHQIVTSLKYSKPIFNQAGHIIYKLNEQNETVQKLHIVKIPSLNERSFIFKLPKGLKETKIFFQAHINLTSSCKQRVFLSSNDGSQEVYQHYETSRDFTTLPVILNYSHINRLIIKLEPIFSSIFSDEESCKINNLTITLSANSKKNNL